MGSQVGVLALQGDFSKHLQALADIGANGIEVRSPSDLSSCSHIIIPGGESTTLGILLESSGLDEAIREKKEQDIPIWGTCMGMILMAREIQGYDQPKLEFLDIVVERNAWGAQVRSFEADVDFKGLDSPLHAVFIRAPAVTKLGPNVERLAEYEGRTIAVRQGKLMGTSFHPELTVDRRLHQLFLNL